jgi:hypothetical protein
VSVEASTDGATVIWETDDDTGTYHLLIAKQETARAEAVVRSDAFRGQNGGKAAPQRGIFPTGRRVSLLVG